MAEEKSVFEIFGQIKEKVRSEDEKESFNIVMTGFLQYIISDDTESSNNILFERFLVNFNKLKSLVKDAPQRIEIKATNERNYKFKKLVVDLMLDEQKIVDFGKNLIDKRFTVPTGYEQAKSDFLRYKEVISKVGRRTIRTCFDKINVVAEKNDIIIPAWVGDVIRKEEFYNFKPDFFWIEISLENSIVMNEDNGEMKESYEHALKSLNFLESEVVGSDFDTLYGRWKETPSIFVPEHVATHNPQTLYTLYAEVVRTYTSGNFLACIAMCRALFEHILINYYGANGKDLEEKISNSESKFESLRELRLQNKRRKANRILHNYRGENIENKIVLNFIKTVKALIEKIPQKKIQTIRI